MLERIDKINAVAQENFEKAKGMLEMFNDIYGLNYTWLAKRVVVWKDDNEFHDVWALLKYNA